MNSPKQLHLQKNIGFNFRIKRGGYRWIDCCASGGKRKKTIFLGAQGLRGVHMQRRCAADKDDDDSLGTTNKISDTDEEGSASSVERDFYSLGLAGEDDAPSFRGEVVIAAPARVVYALLAQVLYPDRRHTGLDVEMLIEWLRLFFVFESFEEREKERERGFGWVGGG